MGHFQITEANHQVLVRWVTQVMIMVRYAHIMSFGNLKVMEDTQVLNFHTIEDCSIHGTLLFAVVDAQTCGKTSCFFKTLPFSLNLYSTCII